jgi:hypothetical protein
MTSPSPPKRLRIEESKNENVCGQVLRLPDLLKLFVHYKGIGNTGSEPCEALASAPFAETLSDNQDHKDPVWTIGSYQLTPGHLSASVEDQNYSWLPYLDIAIEAFNCNVEDYSYCFPVDFFLLTKEDKHKQFLKPFHEKAEYHSPDMFQEKFWQAPWQILLPVQQKKTEDALLDVVFITNQYKDDTWECTIDTLYSVDGARYLDDAKALLNILMKTFIPVDYNHKVAKVTVDPPPTKETSTATVGRLVALLLKCKDARILPIASVHRLLQYLHVWLHNAVHCYDPADNFWVECEVENCTAAWRHLPRGALPKWEKAADGAKFSCYALGKQCTFMHDPLQARANGIQDQLKISKALNDTQANENQELRGVNHTQARELVQCANGRTEEIAKAKEAARTELQKLHDIHVNKLANNWQAAMAEIKDQLETFKELYKTQADDFQKLHDESDSQANQLVQCAEERI